MCPKGWAQRRQHMITEERAFRSFLPWQSPTRQAEVALCEGRRELTSKEPIGTKLRVLYVEPSAQHESETSVSNLESGSDDEASHNGRFICPHFDASHHGTLRSLSTAINHLRNAFGTALKDRLDRSVMPVTHPAVDAELCCVHFDEGAVANSLHSAPGPKMNGLPCIRHRKFRT